MMLNSIVIGNFKGGIGGQSRQEKLDFLKFVLLYNEVAGITVIEWTSYAHN